MSTFKGKSIEYSKDMLSDLSSSTLNHPIRNLAYAFGAGIILAFLIK